MIAPEAIEKLRRLMEARQKRDEDKVAAEASEREYREMEAEVYESLEESQTKGSIKIDLGPPWGTVSFSPRETYFGRIIDKEKAMEHFEQRAMVEEISEPKFAMKRIHEIVRNVQEQGGNMPPGVDYYARRGVTITRQKG